MSTNLKREDFNRIYKLYPKQKWLLSREKNLFQLFQSCEKVEHKDLVFNLLYDFNYIDEDILNSYLNSIADWIINDSGFSEDKTQIVALAIDSEADSSQSILNLFKMPLYIKGWHDFKTVNNFIKILKRVNEGYTQIILLDEFIGAGSTIRNRLKELNKMLKGLNYEIKICAVAGMDFTLNWLINNGYELFCPLQLSRGLCSKCLNDDNPLCEYMNQLESKLASQIGTFELSKYSFGYDNAQALYSMHNWNTPNSVFPIFWWPKDENNMPRVKLLTRFEKGL